MYYQIFQINKCLDAANSAGLSTDDVFMAGHRCYHRDLHRHHQHGHHCWHHGLIFSLGGVVLQSYIATHSTAARAVAFLGETLMPYR